MQASATHDRRIEPTASAGPAVAALFVYECHHDTPLVAIPRPEIHLVVRFGPSTRNGLDVHAMGVRETAHRKLIRRGLRGVARQRSSHSTRPTG